jgi:hypothetical protein
VREQIKTRNYRWRQGDGREKYLEGKARESERRAMCEGRTHRPRHGREAQESDLTQERREV